MERTKPKGRYRGAMAAKYPSSVETLRGLIEYDARSGGITHKGGYGVRVRPRPNGYNYITLPSSTLAAVRGVRDAKAYRADHLAWFISTGQWPDGWIEHINGLLSDDSLDNLVLLDTEGRRWWFGAQHGEEVRRLVRVEDAKDFDGPAVVRVERGDDVAVAPVVAEGWVEGVRENTLPTIDEAPEYPKGEFGVDWS